MTIDASPAVVIAILGMMAATHLTRAGGYWLMGYVSLTPRVRRMLEASPGAVIVATVLPLVARDGAAAAAVMTGAVVMYFLRRDYIAVFAGMAAAAALRFAVA